MIVDVDSPAFEALIDPDAELVRLGGGYQFTEGPVWNPRDQSLYFSDIPGDTRWRWSEAGGMELVAEPTFKGNGMALRRRRQPAGVRAGVELSRLASAPTASASSWRSTTRACTSTAQRCRGPRRSTAASTSPIPTTAAGTTGSAASASSSATSRASTASHPAAAQSSSSCAADEFEQPERAVLLARREAAVRQRFATRRGQGLRRGRRRQPRQRADVPTTRSAAERWARATVDGMECDEHGNIWTSPAPAVCGCSIPTASGSGPSARRRSAAAWCSAAPICAPSSSRRPPLCT